MRTIFLSAGHSNVFGQDRGAEGNGYIEGNLAVELRHKIVVELQKRGVMPKTDPDSNVTAKTVSLFKGIVNRSDIALDIHFNAGPPSATGCEVVIPRIYSKFEYILASELSNIISNTLNIRNRGILTEDRTPRKKLAWMTIPCENVLLEVCFITNVMDMQKYNEKVEQLSFRIADLIKNKL